MSDPTKHVNLRLPEDVLIAMREAAAADARSLNSEIMVALREWLVLRQTGPAEPRQGRGR